MAEVQRGRPKTRKEEEVSNLRNVNFRADRDFVKAFRMFCIEHDISMQDFIKQAIQEKMERAKAKNR